jgi:hypothetical protein
MSRGSVSGVDNIQVAPKPAFLISSTEGGRLCTALNSLSKALSCARREGISVFIPVVVIVVVADKRRVMKRTRER